MYDEGGGGGGQYWPDGGFFGAGGGRAGGGGHGAGGGGGGGAWVHVEHFSVPGTVSSSFLVSSPLVVGAENTRTTITKMVNAIGILEWPGPGACLKLVTG